jgi:glutamine amidotransferase
MSRPDIVVIDFGVGNLLSVQRGIEHCGANVEITSSPDRVLAASRLVLPGVGAFSNAMNALTELGLVAPIREAASRGVPLLGICLGMQMLMDESEEFGLTKGLGLIAGRVIPVPSTTKEGLPQKIPHIGWNALIRPEGAARWTSSVMEDVVPGDSVYFVHSFMAVPSDPSHRIADCVYGGHRVAGVIGRDRIVGCQFHPEKSGPVGLNILRRFCHGA